MKIRPDQLAGALRREMRQSKKLLKKAIKVGAARGRTHLVRKTPVDTGQMKNSWKSGEDYIHNDAPHAGIVEGGARPHNVSPEGIESLIDWARRQLGMSEKDAKGIAWGIAKKLAREGQEGKFIVETALPKLKRMVKDEYERLLAQGAKK